MSFLCTHSTAVTFAFALGYEVAPSIILSILKYPGRRINYASHVICWYTLSVTELSYIFRYVVALESHVSESKH